MDDLSRPAGRGATLHRDLLQLPLHRSVQRAQILQTLLRPRHQAALGQTHQPSLTNLLRAPQSHPIVAVSQGAHSFGDICDKETNTGTKGSTFGGHSAYGLTPIPSQGLSNKFPPDPPDAFKALKENIQVEAHSDVLKEGLGSAFKLLNFNLDNSDTLPGEPEGIMEKDTTKSPFGGGNTKLPWWSGKLRKRTEDFVIPIDDEIDEVLDSPTKAEADLPAPKSKGYFSPKAKFKVTKALANQNNKKRFKGSVSIAQFRRPDLPLRRKSKLATGKASLARALDIAKEKSVANNIIKGIEDDYYANSSRSAKQTKRKVVADLLTAAKLKPYPLEPVKLKLIAGVLREAGYKSADSYLVESKTAHIEEGWPWTPLLDRHFKLCVKAVRRGQGPR